MAECDVVTEGDCDEKRRGTVQHKEKPATLSPNVRRAKGALVTGAAKAGGQAVALKPKYSHRGTVYKAERASPAKKETIDTKK